MQDLLLTLLAALLIWLFPAESALFLETPEPTPTATVGATAAPAVATSSAQLYPVTKVRDGDTIEVLYEGKNEAVRLVGINTPETVDPRRPVQCYGKEASAKLKTLLHEKMVTLETDPTQSNRDRYGRLLRFVFLDGQDVGLQMLKEGYAEEAMYSDVPHAYVTQYLAAEAEAKKEGRGLWAEEACGKAISTPGIVPN